MKHTKSRNGFTLIELIIVMVILGIMAAVAVPRYLDSISNAEEAAEDAVISSIRAGLTQYANNSLYESGRAEWPTNPFDALSEKPRGYSGKNSIASKPGQWTFFTDIDGYSKISHMRTNNSIFVWFYDEGISQGYNGKIGTLGSRLQIMD